MQGDDNRLPDFLMVGAAKSGTTSLWHYLRQHPDVFMPVNKEPLFMVSSYYRNLNSNDPKYALLKKHLVAELDEYQALFSGAGSARAVGEASQPYLYHYELAIENIRRYIGDPGIIIVLRNPVDRAISAYTYLLRDGEESRTIEECLTVEQERRDANWSMSHFYRGAGLYERQVKAYLDSFSRVKVFLFEDLVNDAQGVARDTFELIGVDPEFTPDVSTRHNVSGIPKHAWVHSLISNPNRFVDALKPLAKLVTTEPLRRKLIEGMRARSLRRIELPAATRERLKGLFHADIKRLESLINRDLSGWLS